MADQVQGQRAQIDLTLLPALFAARVIVDLAGSTLGITLAVCSSSWPRREAAKVFKAERADLI